MRTLALRRQHDAALELVNDIMAATPASGQIETIAAYRIGLNLAKLTGLLRIHFAQEDKALYPLMTASAYPEAAVLATGFQREMGGLALAYFEFAKRWAASAAIASDSDGFRRDCAAIFGVLDERIRRENEELYPLADQITASMIRSVA